MNSRFALARDAAIVARPTAWPSMASMSHRAVLLALEARRSEEYANQVALRALLVGAPETAGALATAGELQPEVLQAETEGINPRDSVMQTAAEGVEELFAYRLARLVRLTGAWN